MAVFITWANNLPFLLMVLVAVPIGIILGIAGAMLITLFYNWGRKYQS